MSHLTIGTMLDIAQIIMVSIAAIFATFAACKLSKVIRFLEDSLASRRDSSLRRNHSRTPGLSE
jgi:hypothetical protein